MHPASAKTKLLRFDRDLRVVVMEPLKRALIERKKPDYDKLKETARGYPAAVVDICRRWDAEVFPVARRIEGIRYLHTAMKARTDTLQNRPPPMKRSSRC